MIALLYQLSYRILILNVGGGIRTHEADAWDLKPHSFDRSETPTLYEWTHWGLNPGPPRYKHGALTNWAIGSYNLYININ